MLRRWNETRSEPPARHSDHAHGIIGPMPAVMTGSTYWNAYGEDSIVHRSGEDVLSCLMICQTATARQTSTSRKCHAHVRMRERMGGSTFFACDLYTLPFAWSRSSSMEAASGRWSLRRAMRVKRGMMHYGWTKE